MVSGMDNHQTSTNQLKLYNVVIIKSKSAQCLGRNKLKNRRFFPPRNFNQAVLTNYSNKYLELNCAGDTIVSLFRQEALIGFRRSMFHRFNLSTSAICVDFIANSFRLIYFFLFYVVQTL